MYPIRWNYDNHHFTLFEGKGTKKKPNRKEKGRVSPPQLAQSCQTFNYENASISIFIPRASVIFSKVVSDGLRFPFSMSQMVVARMSTLSDNSARVTPRDLRWFLMVAMISSCVMITSL